MNTKNINKNYSQRKPAKNIGTTIMFVGIIAILFIIIALLLRNCEVEAESKYSINYDSNGGSYVLSQT
ncbi:MAG: hypothetical protein LBV51_04650, partial [Acholeplasmatales bacterium]|nr:hypothetical protein [Acholeplasmatales bacterium]